MIEQNLNEALNFLKLIAGEADEVTILLIPESDELKNTGKKPITQRIKLTPAGMKTLKRYNDKGYGVFFTVNKTEGVGRKRRDITAVRALWLDLDKTDRDNLSDIKSYPVKPDIVVNTSKDKYHCYWLVEDCSPCQFDKAMDALTKTYDGDANAKDISRVLRVAGFIHQKNAPFLSKLVEV